jgi:hypothetical protein
MVSIMEAVGLCSFIFYIPGLSKTYHAVLLMNCVILCPLVDNLRKMWKLNSSFFKCASVVAIISVVVGILFTILLLLHTSIRLLIIAPIGVLILSVVWIPSFQKYMAERETKVYFEVRVHLFIYVFKYGQILTDILSCLCFTLNVSFFL